VVVAAVEEGASPHSRCSRGAGERARGRTERGAPRAGCGLCVGGRSLPLGPRAVDPSRRRRRLARRALQTLSDQRCREATITTISTSTTISTTISTAISTTTSTTMAAVVAATRLLPGLEGGALVGRGGSLPSLLPLLLLLPAEEEEEEGGGALPRRSRGRTCGSEVLLLLLSATTCLSGKYLHAAVSQFISSRGVGL
jgi:hypothetical protein